MIDVKLKYGWPVVDSTGNYAVISDDEAQFQKVLICLSMSLSSLATSRRSISGSGSNVST